MVCYHIRIQGHLPDRYAAWFAPLSLTREPLGETLLAGELVDQGALFGILLKIRDLGLPLLTVSPSFDGAIAPGGQTTRPSLRDSAKACNEMQGASMMTRQLTITGFMTIQPDTAQILLPQIDALVNKTRAEPGCMNYDFHQHTVDSHRFVFYENFVDQAAFDAHFAQPHTQEWIALAEAHGAHFDIQHWTMLSQPDRSRQ